jgi:hypothetical protein
MLGPGQLLFLPCDKASNDGRALNRKIPTSNSLKVRQNAETRSEFRIKKFEEER